MTLAFVGLGNRHLSPYCVLCQPKAQQIPLDPINKFPFCLMSILLIFFLIHKQLRGNNFLILKIINYTLFSFSDFSRRNLLQTNNESPPISEEDDDTVRADPLNKLKKYRGGYDITNKHYWSVILSLLFSFIDKC